MANNETAHLNADTDPTVYLPAMVQVEAYVEEGADTGPGEGTATEGGRRFVTLHLPAEHVTLTREFFFVRRPGVPAVTCPLSEIRSIRIDIQPPPDDYEDLRQIYPHAYEPWTHGEIAGVLFRQRAGGRLAELAELTGRPPEHMVRKLANLGTQTGEEQPGRPEPAPIFRATPEGRIEGSYIVSIRKGADPMDVAARHGIDPTGVTGASNVFYAEMTDAQVESLRTDPDTDNLSENQLIYPA